MAGLHVLCMHIGHSPLLISAETEDDANECVGGRGCSVHGTRRPLPDSLCVLYLTLTTSLSLCGGYQTHRVVLHPTRESTAWFNTDDHNEIEVTKISGYSQSTHIIATMTLC